MITIRWKHLISSALFVVHMCINVLLGFVCFYWHWIKHSLLAKWEYKLHTHSLFLPLWVVGEWQVSQSRTAASLEDKAAGWDPRAARGRRWGSEDAELSLPDFKPAPRLFCVMAWWQWWWQPRKSTFFSHKHLALWLVRETWGHETDGLLWVSSLMQLQLFYFEHS